MKQFAAFILLVGLVAGLDCPGNTVYDRYYLGFGSYGGARQINEDYDCPGQTYLAQYTGIVTSIIFGVLRQTECNSNQTMLLDVWNYNRDLIATSTPTFSVGCGWINFVFNVEFNQTSGNKYFFAVRPGTFTPSRLYMLQADTWAGWTHCKAEMCRSGVSNPYEDCGSGSTTYPFAIRVCIPEAICTIPCQNGGMCIGNNSCSCPSTWTGSDCSIPVCSPSCVNGGTCSAPNTCSCPAAWTGPTCSTSACASNPCQNGGTCVGTNTCQCTSSWTGPTCTTLVHNCSSPCQNGGLCLAPDTCTCTAAWTGPTCTTSACASNPCQNGGTCIGTNTCQCTSGWSGSTCTTPVCSPSCANGGTCSAPNTCSCTAGWIGSSCTTSLCSVPCENGGICSAPNYCTCPPAWTGPTCTSIAPMDALYIHFPSWSSANLSTLQATSWWSVVGTSDFTILASIVVQNKTSGIQAGMVITKDVDYVAQNQLRIQYSYISNRLEFYFNQASGSTITGVHDIMGPTLTYGLLYHVAAVRKGVSIILYVSQGGNPAEYTGTVSPANTIISNAASTPWSIGRRSANSDLYLAGHISNARIYNVALNVTGLKAAWGI